MNKVECLGTENNLIWCSKELADGENIGYHKCPGRRPVILHCRPGKMYINQVYQENRSDDTKVHEEDSVLFSRSRQPTGMSVRLKAGGNIGSGRVEIQVDNEWGTICHENWSVESANVVCRQLGFGSAKNAFKDSKFGNGHGQVFWSKVNCTGFEKRIKDCPHETLAWGTCTRLLTGLLRVIFS